VKRLLKRYDEIVIVIGSAENNSAENPFSAGERVEMIRSAFTKNDLSRIIIVPVRDINNHSHWVKHVQSYVPFFDVVYSNNPIVKKLFEKSGVKVFSVSYFDRLNKVGRHIRMLIKNRKKQWTMHVPNKVASFLIKINAEKRLRSDFY
jgi:nicotinamide-nucleotide adenylyltransferase